MSLLKASELVFLGGAASAPLVNDIGLCLLFSGLLAVIFVRFKIPEIAAFLVGGAVIGPIGLGFVKEHESIPVISDIGLVLLLFVIGLEINLKKLLASGKAMFVTGILQFPLCVAFGWAIGLAVQQSGWEIAQGKYVPLYVGLTAAASSTLLVSKLLRQKFQLDTIVGRFAIGILIFQDIWAIIVLAIQPSLPSPSKAVEASDAAGSSGMATIGLTFLGIGIVLLVAITLAKYVLPLAFRWIAKFPDLLLIVALGWCFGIGAFGEHLELILASIGIHLHVMVGMSMGALIAGAAIASMPYAHEVVSKVEVVKNFFVTLFFVALGMQIPVPNGINVLIMAGVLAAVAILARYVVFFPLLHFLGLDRRSSFVASTQLAQISEFCLVIAYLGFKAGHFSDLGDDMSMVSAIIFAFVITALVTPTLFGMADSLHDRFGGLLSKIGFKAPKAATNDEGSGHEPPIVILGFHRVASSILHEIQHTRPDMIHQVLVVDFNVELHEKIRATGASAHYGDVSNYDILHHLGVNKAKVIVCTIPDDVLKGTSNVRLARMLRRLNPGAKIFVTGLSVSSAVEMYAEGADYVMMPRIDAARAVLPVLDSALGGTLTDHLREHELAIDVLNKRHEVLP